MKFRLATEKDANSVSDLVNSVYRGETGMKSWTTEAGFIGGQRTDPQSISEIIKRPKNFIVISVNEKGETVGSVHLEIQNEKCYLGMLTVDWRIQQAGLGSRILQEAERFAREELKIDTMTMNVITIRSELVEWYRKRGYVDTGIRRPFPYGDEKFGLPKVQGLEFMILDKKLR